MSRERALLRRLVEVYDAPYSPAKIHDYQDIGRAASVLLAQPAPEEEDETANVDWERVYHPELYATPPAAQVEQPTVDEIAEGTRIIGEHPVVDKVCKRVPAFKALKEEG